jgi:hypothetical protein
MTKKKEYKGNLIPRLIHAGQEIDENPDDVIQYQHALFCQLSLPRSNTDTLTFERHYHKGCIKIRAGELWDGRKYVQQPLPYGAQPRLILAHINTEAVQRRTRLIDLEGSIARFMERIGIERGGRQFTTFKKQMKALAAADFVMGYTNADNQAETKWQKPIDSFKAWTTTQDGQGVLWPAELTLSHDYYEDLLRHAVPLDARAVIALKHSALALDAYFFLARRFYGLTRPTRIAYKHFHEQFGQEYKSVKDFTREWKKAIATAKFIYPMARITPTNGGLILEPSPPPITGQPPKLVK